MAHLFPVSVVDLLFGSISEFSHKPHKYNVSDAIPLPVLIIRIIKLVHGLVRLGHEISVNRVKFRSDVMETKQCLCLCVLVHV